MKLRKQINHQMKLQRQISHQMKLQRQITMGTPVDILITPGMVQITSKNIGRIILITKAK